MANSLRTKSVCQALTAPANVRRVNQRLGSYVDAAIRRAKLTNGQVAKQAGVSESWVKQLKTGRIDRPAVDKLERIAAVLPVDLPRLLSLTDQLGAVRPYEPAPGGDTQGAGSLAELTAKVQELIEVHREQVAGQNRMADAFEAQNRLIMMLLRGAVPEEAHDEDAADAEALARSGELHPRPRSVPSRP